MAEFRIEFESQYLGGRHPVTIIMPDTPRAAPPRMFFESGRKYKVLWLLHGTFGTCNDWINRSMIEVFACERNLIVVMPNGLNLDYVNWPRAGLGMNMYDYLFEELMPMVYNWLPASDKREDNFIAGLSMGGSGAMIYALGHPEKFAAAASLSYPLMDPREEALEIKDALVATPEHLRGFRPSRWENQLRNAGGMEGYLQSPANTWDRLLEAAERGTDLPQLYFAIGTEDFLYPRYQRFKRFAQERRLPIVFAEESGMRHEWRFWNQYIEIFIKKYICENKSEGLSF